MSRKACEADTASAKTIHVRIDPAKCQGHGRCVLIAPDYFDIDDTGFGVVLVSEVAAADRSDIDEAVMSCPENAIVVD